MLNGALITIGSVLIAGLITTVAMAHPNGTYRLDGNSAATVTFTYEGACPSVPDAMEGGLRTLIFTATAEAEPYNFVTGFYVETHTPAGETYVQTNDQCVPKRDGLQIEASRRTFGGYSLQRVR